MKLFLGANILFTDAHNEKGISQGLFRLAERGACSLVTSAYAVDEAKRNISLKFPLRGVPDLLIESLAMVREPQLSTVAVMTTLPLVNKDTPIMAAAVECHADCLVSGDRRDFGHLYGRVVMEVLVLNPGEAMERALKMQVFDVEYP